MTLAAGTRIGPYEILSPLGAGGMGEVYRARDTQLDREVAIKALPRGFAGGRDRLVRFEREAKMLAALNHPAIASIYGLVESENERFLILELVPGETLAERLASGPLPLEEVLAFSRQIAEALEAAHEKGIVHRDLKPANVKVTPSGKVKVLDFGLAKAFGNDQDPTTGLTHSPTITAGGTQQGVVLGTAPYMSPEQARGKPVDRRADIWSFGCVLYESLTGRRAFEGETLSDVMVFVLTRDPDWGALPASTPGRVRNLLRRCLHKDPDRRLHDAADARLELEDATAEIGSVSAPETARVEPKRGFSGWMLFGAAVAGAAIAALLSWRLRHRTAAAGVPRIGELARLTEPVGRADWPNWSPDGSLLTYASDRSGDFEIYVRRSGGDEDINVTKDPGQDIEPAFSPDGNSIAFISTRSSRTGLIKIGSGAVSRSNRTYGGDLWLVPSLGGAARRLAPDANYPAWRPDGQRILYVSGPESHRAILEVSTAGGTPRPILPSHDSTWEIQWLGCSPDGRWVTFEDQIGGIFLMPVSGGKPTKIASGFSHGWDASSRRLWSLERETNGGTRVRFLDIDPERGVVRGAPRTVGLVMSNLRDLAVSRDARRLVVTEEETSRNLTRLPLSPDGGAADGPEEVLSQGQVIDDYPQVSPDGKRIAYISNTLGRTDVWILDLQTRRRLRFQLPGEDLLETEPAWMPNGKDLVVVRNFADEVSAAWLAALDGSHADEIFRSKSHSVLQIRCSPDGSSWLISELSGREQIDLYDLASRKMRSITSSPGDMYKYDAEWSPDGRWIALTQSDGVALQLFRIPAWGGAMQQLTTGYERMRHPFFSPDGKWIYVQPSHRNIFRVRAEGGSLEQVTHFPEAGLFLEEPTMTPDGRYLVYCRENGGSSLWLMTLDGGDPIH